MRGYAMWGLMLLALPAWADPGGDKAAVDKVLQCMRANVPPTLRIQEIELQATDRAGASRTMRGKLFAMRDKGLLRAMVHIAEPTDLAGAAYLVRETASDDHADEMYMFLPAMNRVRRITGASADGSFLGTDFSYNDVKQIENAFGDTDGKLEKPEQIEQHPVHVITFKPKADQSSRYSLLRAWVDQKTCVALKVDFFEGDVPRKELSAPVSAIQQSGNYWYLSQALMQDLKDHTSTRLKVVGVSSGTDLATRYFDPHSFYLGN
ncbi:outer membrane lipoprotein-sorting protein [Nevskia soli]|uniref:outer membrane lipoprotein-sorting protein n=1 Tax=Nevskia soli TaxID=418856 RepID=UPI0004A6E7D7|nr:outer membrane lipoprotein-sorting protein [Nevskia soli]